MSVCICYMLCLLEIQTRTECFWQREVGQSEDSECANKLKSGKADLRLADEES